MELRQRVAELEVEVSEHKHAKEILQDYHKVIENSQDMIAVVDQYYKYLLVNARYLKYCGMDREQVVGKSVAEILGKDVFEKDVKKKLDTCFRGEAVRYEMKRIYPELGERGLLVEYFPIENSEGINRVVSVIRDITDFTQVEETLRESQKRYRSLFENMLDGYAYCRMLFDENDQPVDFEYLDVNNAFEKLTGLKNVVGRRVSEVIPSIKESHPELFEIYGRTALTGEPQKFEVYLEPLKIWLSISAYGIQRGYFVAVFDNITERKKAEEALKKSEERFKELYNDAPIGYFEYNTEGCITNVNRTELEMLGYSVEEMIGQPPWKFIVEEDIARQQILNKLAGIMPPARGLERTYRRKDGTTFPALVQDRLLRDAKGSIKGIRATIQDVTDSKRAEEALRNSEERYRTLFEGSRDVIFITTQGGEILDANQSMFDLFGYSRDEMIGLNARETYAHSEDRFRFQQKIEREGFVRDYEIKLKKKDGTEMECLFTAIVRRTADGDILGYQGIIRDITERKRMEEEREKLIDELQEALANIKTLRGLLPICSYCKKIRDDKGYWNQIESYIRDHSGAEFTHGMCPECLKKLYPDLVD